MFERGRAIFTSKHLGFLIKQYTYINNVQPRNLKSLLPVMPGRQILLARTIHVPKTESDDAKYPALDTVDPRKSWILGLLRKTKFLNPDKYRRMMFGTLLYERLVDNIDYDEFFKTFEMPDTFFSWFLVTEVHIWMLMVRLMAIPNTGQIIRNHMIETMWKDVYERQNKLGPMRASVKKKDIKQISNQFNAAVIGYDEGMVSDDKVLAAALWRRFFNAECNNPLHVEKLLVYVRKQLVILDEMTEADLLRRCYVKWINLKTV